MREILSVEVIQMNPIEPLRMVFNLFEKSRIILNQLFLTASRLWKFGACLSDLFGPLDSITLKYLELVGNGNCRNSSTCDLPARVATDPFPGNGFFPIFNSDKFTFVVENPAVAILQIAVYDKEKGSVVSGDDFVAGSSIPISCLRRGVRSVKLFDGHNTRSGPFDFACLLVDLRIERAVAEI